MKFYPIVNFDNPRYCKFHMYNKKTPPLFLLICLVGFPQISETIYTPALPDLARALGVGMDWAEFTLTTYFVGFAFGVLTFGILSDIFGRRASMLFGISVYWVGCVACSYAESIEILLLFRFIQACGAAAGSVVTQTILRDVYTGTARSRAFAVISGALAFSPAVGPFLGGIIDQFFSWRANFHFLSAMGLIFGVVSFFSLPETKPLESAGSSRWNAGLGKLIREMALDRQLCAYVLLIGASNGIIFSYYAEAPFLFIEVLRLTPIQYGCLGMVVASSSVMASFLSIRLNQLYSSEKTVGIGAGITSVGALLFWLVSQFLDSAAVPSFETALGLFFAMVGLFVGLGLMIPNCLSHALARYRDRSGTAGSLFGFAYYGLIAGFTGLMSLLHNGSPRIMPAYFFLLSLGMILICRFVLRDRGILQTGS